MEPSKEATRSRLEQLLARIQRNRGRDGEEPVAGEHLTASPVPAVVEEPLAAMEIPMPTAAVHPPEEVEEILELADTEEISVDVEEEEVVADIPEEFEEDVDEVPVEFDAEPVTEPVQVAALSGPMEIEPPAPVEPGFVAPEAAARAHVQAIDVSTQPVETEVIPETRPAPKPTVQMPVVPAPSFDRRPVAPPIEVAMPEPTVPGAPVELPTTTFAGTSPVAGARPAVFTRELRQTRPRTMSDILRAALRVGQK